MCAGCSCFELYIAGRSHYTIRVIFCPAGLVELKHMYAIGGVKSVRDAFAHITTADAEASTASDAKAITELVENQLPKGFATLDQILREKLSTLVIETLADDDTVVASPQQLQIEELQRIIEEQQRTIDGLPNQVQEQQQRVIPEQQRTIHELKKNAIGYGAASAQRQQARRKQYLANSIANLRREYKRVLKDEYRIKT